EAGSIPYSAVIHPRPLPTSQRGTPSSMDAVQSTRVFPKEISTEPSACSTKSGTTSIARSSSGRRPPPIRLPPARGRARGPAPPPHRGAHRRRPPRGERELQEALAQRPELVHGAGREEARASLSRRIVLDSLP